MAKKFLLALLVVSTAVGAIAVAPATGVLNPVAQDFVPLDPCSVADTRFSTTPSPVGKLTAAGGPYTFTVAGTIPGTQRNPADTCSGAPAGALGVMVNVIAIQAEGTGNLRVSAAGQPASGGVVNYQLLSPALTNSNAVPVEIGQDGQIDVAVNGGNVHVRLVVMGYFTAAPTSTAVAGSTTLNNVHPVETIHCIIALTGVYPSRNGGGGASEPMIGEIRWFAGNFAPSGYAFCDGQSLPISQNTALFSILGTIYGGDGRTTFNLPDMRGRSPMHAGTGPGLSPRNLGGQYGSETVVTPQHSHPIPAG